jgi:asparagine synthetase B (glutamine-hydrolysing)
MDLPESSNNNLENNWPDTWVILISNSSDFQTTNWTPLLVSQSSQYICWYYPGHSFPQPSIYINKDYFVIFDGHLYNTKEIYQELKLNNIFSSEETSEILFHAYSLYGKNLFGKLKGCFVLLIWDAVEEMLLFTRDPIGIYPLFYSEVDQGIIFSLSIDALRKQPEVSGSLDRAVLVDFLILLWTVDKQETFFESIKRLPAGYLGNYSKHCLSFQRYWSPVKEDGQVDWIKENAGEQFEALIYKAIDDLLDFGPSAIFLSGGLDSVTTAVLASDQARHRGLELPHAFSLIFPNIGKLEEPVQRAVANDLQIPLDIRFLEDVYGSQGILQSCIELNQTWPVPVLNFWRPVYSILGQTAKNIGKKIILTGTGGDEWLGLSPIYAADLFRRLNFHGLYQLLKGMKLSFPIPFRHQLKNTLWHFGLRPLLAGKTAQFIHQRNPQILRKRRMKHFLGKLPEWLTLDSELRQKVFQRMEQRVENSLHNLYPGSFYLQEIGLSLDHALTSLDLEEEFESSRRLGIPVIGFYQHQDLVDFLFRLSPEVLNTGGPSKGLVRSFLIRRFPNLGFLKQKKIFALDIFKSIVVNESPRAWEKLGGMHTFEKMGIVDNNKVSSLYNVKNMSDFSSRKVSLLWHLLDMESWVKSQIF